MERRAFLAVVGAVLAARAVPARALPLPPPALRRLHLVNAHTGETFSGTYRDDKGPIARVMAELDIFLRDTHSGAETRIDVGVLDFLAATMDSVGATRATVLSAYRTRATNEMLARTTFGVAEHSQHIYGRALDIYLAARLEDAMTHARAMQRGGVGWYPRSGFIHLDSGPVRNWTLDGRDYGRLLFDGRNVHFPQHMTISPDGELLAGGTRHRLNVDQRLVLHRLLARAEYLAGTR